MACPLIWKCPFLGCTHHYGTASRRSEPPVRHEPADRVWVRRGSPTRRRAGSIRCFVRREFPVSSAPASRSLMPVRSAVAASWLTTNTSQSASALQQDRAVARERQQNLALLHGQAWTGNIVENAQGAE